MLGIYHCTIKIFANGLVVKTQKTNTGPLISKFCTVTTKINNFIMLYFTINFSVHLGLELDFRLIMFVSFIVTGNTIFSRGSYLASIIIIILCRIVFCIKNPWNQRFW